jgi:Rps23 Pro-64 3,4-dihydroxylase Tpa1-like proline 4-hydroxylase
MTPKQILDSFSETLMQDERILSAQERSLLKNLLHHARLAALEPETHAAVNATIASAVGETVAQRAFAVLGSSIVERILEGSRADSNGLEGMQDAGLSAKKPSSPGQPRPPQPKPTPKPPEPSPLPKPKEVPIPPPMPSPLFATKRPMAITTPVLERPDLKSPPCVVLDEFLAPQELQELMSFALEREAEFCASEVVSGLSGEGGVNEDCRRSSVLMDLGRHQDLVLARIQSALPLVLSRLGMEEFSVTHAETQITASNDGDFFKSHNDNGGPTTTSRQLTFVYFFHREPRPFAGGELRIYDSQGDGRPQVSGRSYQSIVPQQNQIVFFPCQRMHEITPVECPSKLFADSRFTLNGWLHK